MNPLVSCIITTHNRVNLLEFALNSVLAQTYPELEIFIIDDGSEDTTPEVCQAWARDDERIRYIRVPFPQGANHARNIGISQANGKYVAFLDDDDEWKPDKIKIQCEVLEKTEESFTFCSKYLAYTNDQHQVVKRKLSVEERDVIRYEDLLTFNWIGETSKIMVLTSLARDVRFDENLTSAQDYDFYLRILQRGYVAINVKEVLVDINIHSGPRISTSTSAKYKGQRKIILKYYNDMSKEQKRRQLQHYRMLEWSRNRIRNHVYLKKALSLYPWWRDWVLLKRNTKIILLGYLMRFQARRMAGAYAEEPVRMKLK
ncbi:glycosyltransferase family 2 protein [Paenibacillus polysaccharolyticus]|uniref:glycosyltransferase family 2 protein n=1 Tax=Paenibacillus polysaccharolyticus TaxID=582692 RepID=UPI00203BE6FB|nr:glycosyltransferase family 2 protein [Paenibacillus polysaccharolyticus]MCM3135337.1 glycosyltransferase family 2 protein [Paenibacillus polysaccharolyticus]